MTPNPLLSLWSTPLGLHRFEQANEVNPLLVRVFRALRASDSQASPSAAFYASGDDLLERIRLPEWEQLVRFIVDGLRQTVVLANQHVWQERAPGLRIALRGIWFQIANRGSHHDVHTHGNCSWSGVYAVQVDPPALSKTHPLLGATNGVTRFYGPHFNHLGGRAYGFWQCLFTVSAP
jgi:hypothetical protein